MRERKSTFHNIDCNRFIKIKKNVDRNGPNECERKIEKWFEIKRRNCMAKRKKRKNYGAAANRWRWSKCVNGINWPQFTNNFIMKHIYALIVFRTQWEWRVGHRIRYSLIFISFYFQVRPRLWIRIVRLILICVWPSSIEWSDNDVDVAWQWQWAMMCDFMFPFHRRRRRLRRHSWEHSTF